MKRRDFLRGLVALPLLGILGLVLPEPIRAKTAWHHRATIVGGGKYSIVEDGRIIFTTTERATGDKPGVSCWYEDHWEKLEEGRPCHWKESTRKFYSGGFNTPPKGRGI